MSNNLTGIKDSLTLTTAPADLPGTTMRQLVRFTSVDRLTYDDEH